MITLQVLLENVLDIVYGVNVNVIYLHSPSLCRNIPRFDDVREMILIQIELLSQLSDNASK